MMDSSSASPRRRWVAVALFASIALNLFFAGLLVGRPMFGGPDHARGAGGPPATNMMPSPRMFISILGPQEGRKVLRELRSEVPDLRQKFKAIRVQHTAVVEAMRAEPYDPQALADAFEAVRDAHVDLTSSIQTPLTRMLANLSPEQRDKFADAFMNMRGPGGRQRDGVPGGRGPERAGEQR